MNRPARSSQRALRHGEAAAGWNQPPAPQTDRPHTRLLSFVERRQGALRGFASIELPSGLRLHDVAIFVGGKGPWAALPSKPVLDRDRRQKLAVDGKPAFAPVAEWRDRRLAEGFSTAVVQLVRAANPGVFDDT